MQNAMNLLSEQYRNYSYSNETVWKVLKLSRQYGNYPDSIETVRTVLQLSGEYLNCPNSISDVQTVYKLSKQYLNCPNSIQTVQKQSKLSRGKQLETIHFAWAWFAMCRQMWAFKNAITCQPRKNFPDPQKNSG